MTCGRVTVFPSRAEELKKNRLTVNWNFIDEVLNNSEKRSRDLFITWKFVEKEKKRNYKLYTIVSPIPTLLFFC